MTEETKKCPFCAEAIKKEAVVCKHCGGDLNLQNDETKKKPKKKKRKLLLGVIAIFFGCIILFVLFSDNDPKNNSINKPGVNSVEDSDDKEVVNPPTPVPAPTEIVAPSIETILADVENMTDAQRNAYNETLKGNVVIDWKGTVTEVDEGEIFGGFSVFVKMLDSSFLSEVHIDVSEEVALSLNKNQEIIFSGTIKMVSDILGTTVYIENAVIEPIN